MVSIRADGLDRWGRRLRSVGLARLGCRRATNLDLACRVPNLSARALIRTHHSFAPNRINVDDSAGCGDLQLQTMRRGLGLLDVLGDEACGIYVSPGARTLPLKGLHTRIIIKPPIVYFSSLRLRVHTKPQ